MSEFENQQLLDKANTAKEAGEWEEARALFGELAVRLPGNAGILTLLARCLAEVGEEEAVLPLLERALKIAEDGDDEMLLTTIRYNTARTLQGAGRHREAIELYAKVTPVADRFGMKVEGFWSRASRAEMLWRGEKIGQALRLYDEAEEHALDAFDYGLAVETYILRAKLHEEMGEHRKSWDAYEAGFRLGKDHDATEAWLKLMGDWVEFASFFREDAVSEKLLRDYLAACAEHGSDTKILSAMGTLAQFVLHKPDKSEGIRLFEQVAAEGEKIGSLYYPALALWKIAETRFDVKDYDKAIELLERSMSYLDRRGHDGHEVIVMNLLAKSFIQANRHADAERVLKNLVVLTRAPNAAAMHMDSALMYGSVLQHFERYDEAAEQFLESARGAGENGLVVNAIEALFMAGANLRGAHKMEEAVQHLEKVIELEAEAGIKNYSVLSHVYLGWHALLKGDRDPAAMHAIKAQMMQNEIKNEKYAPHVKQLTDGVLSGYDYHADPKNICEKHGVIVEPGKTD